MFPILVPGPFPRGYMEWLHYNFGHPGGDGRWLAGYVGGRHYVSFKDVSDAVEFKLNIM